MTKLWHILAVVGFTLMKNVFTAISGEVSMRRDTSSDITNAPFLPVEMPQDNNPTKVCYYGNTRFFLVKEATEVFAMESITFLRDVALRSFNEALTAHSQEKVHVMIPIKEFAPHFETAQALIDFLQPVVDTYDRLDVDFSPNAYQKAAKSFASQDCDWIVSVKLDADDVLSPGYLDWITRSIIPTLHRGALVASRKLARLNYGFGRCFVDPEKHFDKPMGLLDSCPYFGGWSVGQAQVLRRDIFEALGMPFDSDAHAVNLSVLRANVLKRVLKRAPPPLLDRDFNLVKNFTLFKDTDAEMETLTGIKMIETTEAGFGPAGIYMKMPLSSHFPFNDYPTYGECTPELWSKAIANATLLNKIKGNFEYVYNYGEQSKMTLLDLCKSSGTWRNERRSWFGAKTCEDMDKHFQTLISWRKIHPAAVASQPVSLWESLTGMLDSIFGGMDDESNWGDQGALVKNAMKNFTLSNMTLPNMTLPNMTMLQIACQNSTSAWEKEMFAWFGLVTCEELEQPLIPGVMPDRAARKRVNRKVVHKVEHKFSVGSGIKITRKSRVLK